MVQNTIPQHNINLINIKLIYLINLINAKICIKLSAKSSIFFAFILLITYLNLNIFKKYKKLLFGEKESDIEI